jgi:hypothetical protein
MPDDNVSISEMIAEAEAYSDSFKKRKKKKSN